MAIISAYNNSRSISCICAISPSLSIILESISLGADGIKLCILYLLTLSSLAILLSAAGIPDTAQRSGSEMHFGIINLDPFLCRFGFEVEKISHSHV